VEVAIIVLKSSLGVPEQLVSLYNGISLVALNKMSHLPDVLPPIGQLMLGSFGNKTELHK
jgi:hypothetical protein